MLSPLEELEAKHRAELAAHPAEPSTATAEDVQARVAEVIAATRAIALRGQR